MLSVTVNGKTVQVENGATLLDAANAATVHVPTLCFHPRLPSHGVCRICLVEVNREDRAQPACITPARDGDVVTTDTEALIEFRKTDLAWLLARHPNDCIRCEVSGSCQFQNLVSEYELEDRWPKLERGSEHHPEHRLIDHTSPSIWRDLTKCIECGLCAEACGASGQNQHVIGFAEKGSGRIPVTVFDRALAQTNCISCGQCTVVCPVGALIEAPHWHEVLHTLDHRRRVSVVQVAPATRVAISEEFGMQPGTISTGRTINALRELGFDYVFDTNFAADLTIMEEGTEFLERLEEQENLPLFTSCCPGWINWVEINRPDLLAHLSTTKSPQQMHGALTKRGAFARSLVGASSQGMEEPYVVSIMPCTAKKDESERPGVSGDIDHVLTTRELARMIKARGIAFNALPEQGDFDSPLGDSTGAAQIFGASGGVMEAVVRTAAHLIGEEQNLPLEWHQMRGVGKGVKSAIVPGIGQVAICNGIAAAQELLSGEHWRDDYVAIEVMACVGGCLGGGGEPKSLDPKILEKRMQAIYQIDRNAPRRRSHENPDIQRLYRLELDKPGSERAHSLLHTHYAARGSERLLLMRFLDCVDRRDGQAAASLFQANGVWDTASAFGELHGRAAIESFIQQKLPARQSGIRFQRHQMASRADPSDLTVVTPAGETCRFSVDLTTEQSSDGPGLSIRKLVREVV